MKGQAGNTLLLKCRTCMAETMDQISLLELKNFNEDYLRIADILNMLTNIDFNSDHQLLPTKLCEKCAIEAENAFVFRQKCINTERELQRCLSVIENDLKNVKAEPIMEEYLLLNNDEFLFEDNNECESIISQEEKEEIIHEIDLKIDDVKREYLINVLKEEEIIKNDQLNNNKIIVSDTCVHENNSNESVCSEENNLDEDKNEISISNLNHRINLTDNCSKVKKMNNRLLIYKCPTCDKGFDRDDKMKRHAKIHNVHEQKYFCEYCRKGYKMLQTYKSHMKSHDPNNTNKCSYCNSIFSTAYELERHVRTHTGERPFKCDECDKGFAQRNGLVRHLVNFHKKDIGYSEGYGKTPHKKKPSLCEVCGVEKKNAFALKIHMRQHTGEKPYRCEICFKGFVVPFQLKMHMRSHTGEKPHQCDLCEKSFSQRIGLDVHRRTHTGEKPCICEICDKAFTVPSHLKMHMRSHTGEKPFKCEVCDKGFTQNTILQNHMKSHTGNTFNCVFCKKGFNQKHNLKRHMKIHTGEKPYECNICSRRFSEKLSMKYHVQTHSGEKPYSKLAARLKAKSMC